MNGPRSVCIEVTTTCNASCDYCPLGGHGRRLPPRSLTPELLGEITARLPAEWNPRIELGGYGEALLHSGITEIVSIAAESAPGRLVATSSNGLLVDESILRDLARAGLSELTISVNTLNDDLSGAHRVPAGSFGEIIKVVSAFRRRSSGLSVSAQLFAHRDGRERAWIPLLEDAFDIVYVRPVSNWNGIVEPHPDFRQPSVAVDSFSGCSWSRGAIMIDAEGRYAPCCCALAEADRPTSVFDLPVGDYWRHVASADLDGVYPAGYLDGLCSGCTNGANQYFDE